MPGEEAASGGDCVKVAVRCRPPSTKEIANNEGKIVEMVEAFTPEQAGTGQVILNDPAEKEEPAKFAFDIVFGLTIRQSDIYESVGRPALLKTFEGYNGTIFAYGQTGSGKSFTMAGVEGDDFLEGITPRVNRELFTRIDEQQSSGTRRFLVQCSYFEIYNEIIFDLLNPVSDRSKLGGGLQVKEHPVLGIYVKDLTEIVAEDAKKLEQMLNQGNKSRAVSSTLMNSTSSRSHSIFTIKVHQKDTEDTSRNVFAKLNLVDLAGSERQKGTGASGQTLKEGSNINKSLSALGNVINALVESASGKKVFIPYRNSKLTRVLQESLGGNSLCTMLATLSPAACNFEETMSTLRYANRAKAIKVSATKNEEASQISRLKAEVEELKKKLSAGEGAGDGPGRGLTESEREQERINYDRQLKDMESMLNSNWGDKAKLSEEHERQLAKCQEERRIAEQAIEEARSRRLKLLQEKNDLELSIRGLIDFVPHVPKTGTQTSPVLSGEQPRHWLKTHRSLKLCAEELQEQCTMVLVYKHAFDEDVRLWGEGVETNESGLAATGLTRCIPKLEKLRKGGEKLLQLQVDSLGPASELLELVQQASVQTQVVLDEVKRKLDEDQNPSKNVLSKHSSLSEVCHMLSLVETQVQEKIDDIEKRSEVEMLQTCEMVLQFAMSSAAEPECDKEASKAIRRDCEALASLNKDPSLAALPASMPAKPLSEYGPEDVQNSPETTEALLGQLIRWEGLCGGKTRKTALELLTRPPPKFLLDVTISMKKMTGFPPNIEEDWPESRDGKLARFQSIADTVAEALGTTIDFEPADILKGKEVSKTLHLLQLLAVAAAKQKPLQGSKGVRKAGVARPRELSTLCETMMRCIQGVAQLVEDQRVAVEATTSSGEQSLEERIGNIKRDLEEEARSRLRQEDKIGDIERNLREVQNELKHVEQEFEMDNSTSHDPAEEELTQQLEELKSDASSPDETGIIKILSKQVEEVRKKLTQDESEKAELDTKQQELIRQLQASISQGRAVEAEVQRERQRRDMEEELMGQSPEEQKQIMQAHEKKARTRVETIEEQIGSLQSEGQIRKMAIEKTESDKALFMKQFEDAQLQMEIVQEERDAMREAMEQLFNEKAAVDEELDERQQAYISLTERINHLNDDTDELQELVMKKQQGLQGLQAASVAA